MVGRVVYHYHDVPDRAHPGTAETTRLVAKRYFWGHMQQEIGRYVRDCLVCAVAKTQQRQKPAPLHARTPTAPWDMLSIDVDQSRCGNQYMVVIEDVFTKWTEAFAIQDQKDGVVLKVLKDQVVARFGVPKIIVSDQGTCSETFVNNTRLFIYSLRLTTNV